MMEYMITRAACNNNSALNSNNKIKTSIRDIRVLISQNGAISLD